MAPHWVEAIQQREAPHDGATPPGNLERAWTHRQLAQKLASLGGPDVEKLEERLGLVTQKLQKVNALYVEKLAWRAQVERTGLKQQQALNGWLGLYRKIGKGTGKLVDARHNAVGIGRKPLGQFGYVRSKRIGSAR